MRRLIILFCSILVSMSLFIAEAQAPQVVGGVSYPPLMIRDEGADQGRVTRALNCTGSGVTCSISAGVATVDVSGGSGSGLTHPQVMSRSSLGF